MRYSQADVKGGVQPTLLPRRAVAVCIEVLCDLDEAVAVLSVEAIDPVDGKLAALWTKPVPMEQLVDELHRAIREEFLPAVWEHSGPFP